MLTIDARGRILIAAISSISVTGATLARGGEACTAASLRASLPRYANAESSPWPVGPMTGRPVIGDVNRDGHADIVVACGTCCGSKPDPASGHVFALLGDGAGMFVAAPGSPIKVGPSVRKLALGDLDGDGILDIVAAEHDSHELTVFKGDGRGGFSRSKAAAPCVINGSIRNPATGSSGIPAPHTHEVALADVNGDGRLDILAAAVSVHGVACLLNQTDGTFIHAEGSPFRMRTPYDAIAVADMNGDGNIDFIVPSVAGGEINVMLGDGTGAFAAAPASPLKVADRPGYVAVGDCNGDSKPDVFVSHDDITTISVLLNDGDGRLAPAAASPLKVMNNGFCWGITSADLNADGRLDLVIGNAATSDIALLLGDGAGKFHPAEKTLKAGDGAGYVAAADLNADGRPDIVSGNYGSGDVSILLAQPD